MPPPWSWDVCPVTFTGNEFSKTKIECCDERAPGVGAVGCLLDYCAMPESTVVDLALGALDGELGRLC